MRTTPYVRVRAWSYVARFEGLRSEAALVGLADLLCGQVDIEPGTKTVSRFAPSVFPAFGPRGPAVTLMAAIAGGGLLLVADPGGAIHITFVSPKAFDDKRLTRAATRTGLRLIGKPKVWNW